MELDTLLNPQQVAAVRHLQSPLLVLAGAGSGKTRVIIYKILYLLQQCGMSAKHITALTFTNKAASEMSSRIKKAIGQQAKGLTISTFHSVGLKILRHDHDFFNLKKNFTIYDQEDTLHLLKSLTAELTIDDPKQLAILQNHISQFKSQAISPEMSLNLAQTPLQMQAAKLYQHYQTHLNNYHVVDFDDLIFKPLMGLKHNSQLKEKWQNKIHYLLVDEYQDTNISQYELIKLLTGHRGAFTVVGDDHQSIYAWRGANIENLHQLIDDYPTLTTIKLEQNYRSTRTILNASNHLIAKNKSLFTKNLWSTLGTGEPISIITTKDDFDEVHQIAYQISHHHFQHQYSFGHYAILYRSNHQSRLLEKALREHRIPYVLTGGTSFFARTEIKDIICYLKLIANPDDDGAFLRIVNTPKREIGPVTLEKLTSYANNRQIGFLTACLELGLAHTLDEKSVNKLQHFARWIIDLGEQAKRGDPIDMLQELLATIQYDDWLDQVSSNESMAKKRKENVNELVDWFKNIVQNQADDQQATTQPLSLVEAVNKILLFDILDQQQEKQQNNHVQLLTLHAAKGLEFPYVYIAGLEEDILPHKTSIEDDQIEEERRLLYVGMTRAQRELTLTLTKQRKKFNEVIETRPSRFLEELPNELIRWQGIDVVQTKEERQASNKKHLAALKAMLAQVNSG